MSPKKNKENASNNPSKLFNILLVANNNLIGYFLGVSPKSPSSLWSIEKQQLYILFFKEIPSPALSFQAFYYILYLFSEGH